MTRDEWQRHLREEYDRAAETLPDLWSRRRRLTHRAEAVLFGRRVRLNADDDGILAALEEALPAYSQAAEVAQAPMVIDVAVDPGGSGPPLADDLETTFSGRGRWGCLRAGEHGVAWIDFESRTARAVVAPALAARPDILRARLLDTMLLNLLIADGVGMLHASCLLAADTALLVVGDHGAGKTTTSLRAVESGRFQLLTDSMVFVDEIDSGPRLFGFPVGRLKLRQDVADAFRARVDDAPALRPERVRDETKHVLDLAAWRPDAVHRDASTPSRIRLCLLGRSGEAPTSVEPATVDDVRTTVIANSLFHDDSVGWSANLERLALVLGTARCVRLHAGTDPGGVVEALSALAE